MPAHVAIIMDGNGRWAKARGLPRVAGHRAGVEALRATVRAAPEISCPTPSTVLQPASDSSEPTTRKNATKRANISTSIQIS